MLQRISHLFLFIALTFPFHVGASTQHVKFVQGCLANVHCRYLILTAHRQGHKGRGENSLWAFRQQLDRDTDVLEMDTRRTLDGAFILMHDEKVDHTTNGQGSVSKMRLAQVEELTLKGLEEPPPTLDQVLDLVGSQQMLMVDVKTGDVSNVWQKVRSRHLEKSVIMQLDSQTEYDQLNLLLQKGEPVISMVRFRKGLDLEAFLSQFAKVPTFVHIDDQTISPELTRAIRGYGAVPYMHFPKKSYIHPLRPRAKRLIDQGVLFFDTDDFDSGIAAFPDLRPSKPDGANKLSPKKIGFNKSARKELLNDHFTTIAKRVPHL